MPQDFYNGGTSGKNHEEDELEKLLQSHIELSDSSKAPARRSEPMGDADNEEEEEVLPDTDLQGALGLFAEAAQDMATASLELSLGRHFACADYCNQVAEKSAQAVSLLRYGRRTRYDHHLRTLGLAVEAPPSVLNDMDMLTPFHPETFYAETPPEEADEVIGAEQASSYVQAARRILRWARDIVLKV
ncbi:MAG TPA: HEPN domain-containing protein [Ktedonobacteraceae bacterium]